MKIKWMENQVSPEIRPLLIAAVFFLLSLALFDWNAGLSGALESARDDLQTDRSLSQNRSEHERVYREILSRGTAPAGGRQNQNEWMRGTQDLVRQHGLQLREITPVTAENGGQTRLSLVLEGEMQEWFAFLHALSASGNAVYAESFSVSPAEDRPGSLHIEMALAQL